MEKGVGEVSEGELWLENVCWFFEKEWRREALLAVCPHEGEESGERTHGQKWDA